ncbi:MAG: ABC transporter ATP-binding protein [Candidatus Delongbacteria bacterium]|nr:ABC transporter ATP-binding protein [Candidatus Delongbacteria bacterium]
MNRMKLLLQNIFRILRVFPRTFLRLYLLLGLVSSILFVLEYYSPLIQKGLIDEALKTKILFNDYFTYLILVYVVYFGVSFLVSLSLNFIGFKINASLFMYFTEKILLLKKSSISRKGTGYYYDVLSRDTDRLSSLISLAPFNLIFSSIQMILILIVLSRWSMVISIIFLCSFSVSILTSILSSIINQKNMGFLRENASILSNEAIKNISNNFTLKTQLKVQDANYKISEYFNKTLQYMKKLVITQETSGLVLTFFKIAPFIMVVIFSLYLVINDMMTYGAMLAVISYYQLLYNPIKHFSALMTSITTTEVSIKRLLFIIEESKTKNKYNYSSKELLLLPIKIYSFINLNFSYESTIITKEYKNINFELNQGDVIGIVGLAGEGKSTLLKMIYREELAKRGQIQINGMDIMKFPELNYLSRINIYSQELEIFDEDLIYNLVLGRKQIKKNQVEQKFNELKLSIANILDLIKIEINNYSQTVSRNMLNKISKIINSSGYKDLFDVYDLRIETAFSETIHTDEYCTFWEKIDFNKLLNSMTNTEFNRLYVESDFLSEIINDLEISYLMDRKFGENGAFISGGERQKVVFGRFLLKKDFDIFVLDEPFTSLDAIAEKIMLSAAKKHLKHKSGFVISHRFNILLELTDNFVVLENGSITQKGTHRELLVNDGLYKRIFEQYKNQKLYSRGIS